MGHPARVLGAAEEHAQTRCKIKVKSRGRGARATFFF